ncbi:hypothetical protein OFY17_01175 [Marinomonas sp. C2222]|uniref:Esterase YqiA n=1 Tax=Marinomonas sargassi TaxID=2984494 RepID=A0ABT2YNL8_9GAMM|nr:YqiA/YcfP family alpha/beta fold hydrolase [Marinomonas sargassi]MCV2401483.1 hypothetical protein [Marinomonas sargassi]
MPVLLYIHGFNSSESSYKAQLLIETVSELNKERTVLSPRLSWQPSVAIKQLEDIIQDNLSKGVTLIGSSLGGFYASYLAEKYQLKAILINPAVEAPILLQNHLGKQLNPYTDEEYELTQAHMLELESLVVKQPTESLYWLMVQEGDEVLDYRAALKAYPQPHKLTHEKGGNHRFEGFDQYLNEILVFAGIADN